MKLANVRRLCINLCVHFETVISSKRHINSTNQLLSTKLGCLVTARGKFLKTKVAKQSHIHKRHTNLRLILAPLFPFNQQANTIAGHLIAEPTL